MNYVALKPVNFGGKQYKIGETIPEGVVDERRSLFLKKSGHIAEVESANEAYTEDLSVKPNTLSIQLLQSMDEAKIEIATMTEEDTPVLQLLHEIDSRKGIKAAVETRLADLSVVTDVRQETEVAEEIDQPEGGEENDV